MPAIEEADALYRVLRTTGRGTADKGHGRNGDNIRVFLADDQCLVRTGIAAVLNAEEEIEVVGETEDGWEAVDRAKQADPDVVMVSSRLRGLSGPGVTRRLSEALPDVSVVVLAYEREDSLALRALQDGASGCVSMDAPLSDFAGAVRRAHGGGAFVGTTAPQALYDGKDSPLRNGHEEDRYRRLSARERELLPLVADGRTNLEIGRSFGRSPHTVQTHRQRITKKLETPNRAELLKFALRRRLVRLEP